MNPFTESFEGLPLILMWIVVVGFTGSAILGLVIAAVVLWPKGPNAKSRQISEWARLRQMAGDEQLAGMVKRESPSWRVADFKPGAVPDAALRRQACRCRGCGRTLSDEEYQAILDLMEAISSAALFVSMPPPRFTCNECYQLMNGENIPVGPISSERPK